MPPSDFTIRSQVGFQPSSNNSRVVLSEHQHVIISRSKSHPKGHVCIVRKELKNNQKHSIFQKMKRQFLFFFFLENYSIHSPILETHYFGIVVISTFLWLSNWVLNNSYRTSGALQTTTAIGKISEAHFSSNMHKQAQAWKPQQKHTHTHSQSGLCFLWNVFLDCMLGNCPPVEGFG